MDDVVIRHLTPAEWQDYKDLRLEALSNDPDSFGSTYEENASKPEERWRAELTAEMGTKLFAEAGGRLVAMAGAYFEQTDRGTVAHLIGVYTRPSARGNGIMERLINCLVEELKQEQAADTLELQVNRTAEAAVKLYEKLGFVYGEPVADYVRPNGERFPQSVMSMALK